MNAARILVVEDEAIVAMDIARGLKARGYEVLGPATTGEDAVALARDGRPDLVLMDIRLQGAMDGIEAAQEIGPVLGIPVVFLTAHADERTIERAKSAQPFGYLLKPFENAELHGAVAMALNKHQAEMASQAEAAEMLRQSQERFRLLVESLPDYAVFLLDRDGTIRNCNAAATTIYRHDADTFSARPFTLLHSLRSIAEKKPAELLARAQSAGSARTEDWHRRGDDTEFWADVLTTALRNKDDQLIGFACVVRDMTERKRTEEAIRQANATLEQRVAERTRELALANEDLEAFTYSVAHDLRAPLRGIIGYLEALGEDFMDEIPPNARNFLERSVACADRMQRLVEDLLKLSRVGRQELHLIATPLEPLVNQVIAELRAEAMKREIDWRIGPLPTLLCDPGLMRQVFANLLSNAMKYTRPRPRAVIEVGATAGKDGSIISVRDNGVGFDMGSARKLFTPFFRLHANSEFEGTGIGLATTDRIIRRHGGRIWAEAVPDVGASFFFTVKGNN